MEQDVDNGYRTVCSACLSADRNLISINAFEAVYQVFRLLMYEFAGDRFGDSLLDIEQLVCWECLALMKRFARFRKQVQSAQEHLRVLAISQTQESIDHTYMSQSLSSLESYTKRDYDSIFVDYTAQELTKEKWPQQYIAITAPQSVKSEGFDVAQTLRDQVNLGMEDQVLTEMVLENVTGMMPHIVVGSDLVPTEATYTAQPVKGEVSELIIDSITTDATVIMRPMPSKTTDQVKNEKASSKLGYTTEYMTEEEMLASREEAKKKVHYASSVYKCELCIIGFYTEQQVQDHFITAHRANPGYSACKVCYLYVEDAKLLAHVEQHYTRLVCRLCRHAESSAQLMSHHVRSHAARALPAAAIHIGDANTPPAKTRKKKEKEQTDAEPQKPSNLRKLLSKTTIVGYKCLECDMFFKTSRARKNHVARYHREGLQCDHCKKRFVNRTTLATHLRLHEGPLPREECPICHKMVRVIQLKYHMQRHQSKGRYECTECDKVFSYMETYHAHLKYSRAHADEAVFKYPCPMCNKGYPTKESMQDHFNYQHLGKTTHKCPICNKPIASRANVDKHMMRVHGEKKEKPRNHICQQCGKAFTDKKALTQHAVIHSGERPLTCDVCQQSFKQKASLYTHRKRVHKLAPAKRTLTFMDTSERAP
ncbi:uncharacterized protein [Epargyreus clarus]|uniref:uncharacterized protein isoform X2 n=1 Tax=Epargyreus clarus TaxID=520877 RepID=UPI003C2E42A2